ncbi:endonuclease/exonuclease/phosphatase family protein [Alphaproteobacteria bacterium KMM 3653]|uniref:Endonuclease/exonuclease/phosphatase family protein n=1 Tax=Harenicola maris TaxID=2841044 RepID=A0AAP2CP84_9RHOB|nr:endonuclease/exonuclease/phosphatase family protein [Harenicola maris]
MSKIRWFFWCVAGLGLCALAMGFAGVLHPLGDSLAVARTWIAAGGALWLGLGLALGLGARRIVAVCYIALALAMLPVGIAHLRGEAAGTRSIYQKNMLFVEKDLRPLAADIQAALPDVVSLQEVTEANAQIRHLLRGYPTWEHCAFNRVGGTAIASRFEAEAGSVICAPGLTAVRLLPPDRAPFWAVSIHLHWPWPYGQGAHVERLVPLLEGLEGEVVMGGDFNMVPWSASVRRLARAAGVSRLGRVRPSFELPVGWVPIDHTFSSEKARGSTELRPRLGSDHMGVLARY